MGGFQSVAAARGDYCPSMMLSTPPSRIQEALRRAARTGTVLAILKCDDPAACRMAKSSDHAGTKGVKRNNGRLRSVGQHSGVLLGNLGNTRRIPRSDLRPDLIVATVTRFKLPSPLSSAARKRPVAQSPGLFRFYHRAKKPAALDLATRRRQYASGESTPQSNRITSRSDCRDPSRLGCS